MALTEQNTAFPRSLLDDPRTAPCKDAFEA